MKTDHVAQCRFFTPEDACRIALQAYYTATKRITPPPGETWFAEDGSPWASATDFAEAFSGELQARLGLLALDHLGEFYQVSGQWHLLRLACDIEPEKITPLLAKHEAEMAVVYDDIFGDEMNYLPPADNQVNNHQSSGVENA
jgi:hypothetical protein